MNPATLCPTCAKPLPQDAPMGMCPDCLLSAGFGTVTTDGQAEALRAFRPPAPAELAPHFPELEIIELIGQGGMGAVYKARQRELDRLVALKILPPVVGDAPAFAERFAREAKALAKLNHPGIVTLYEFGKTDAPPAPVYFFLMEHVDGVNLRQLLHSSRISAREALAIVPQICDALQFAHDQGIVHRDIKPENILLDRRGRVKVADFGLAKLVDHSLPAPGPAAGAPALPPGLTGAGKVMGTPRYMAPEQAEQPDAVDHRADIYALGVVFYQMLTGELPGQKIEAPSRKVSIDVRLDEVVLRALERRPELRYQQASALKTQVESVATGTEAAGAPSSAAPEGAVRRRPRRIPGKLLLVLACLLGAGTLALYHASTALDRRPLPDSPQKLRRASTAQVIAAGLEKPDVPWAWQELVRERVISPAEIETLMDGLTAWLRREHPHGMASPLHWLGDPLTQLDRRGLLTREQKITLLTALHGDLRPEIPRLREGTPRLAVTGSSHWTWGSEFLGLTLMNAPLVVSVDGNRLEPDNSDYAQSWNWRTGYLTSSWRLPALPPGTHRLKLETASVLASTVELEDLPETAPEADWPQGVKRWHRAVEMDLVIHPRDAVLVRPVVDAALDPLAHGLGARSVVLRPSGSGVSASVKLDLTPKPPIPLGFDVQVRFGDATVNCGSISRFSAANGTVSSYNADFSSGSPEFAVPDESIRTAEVILIPNPSLLEWHDQVHECWGRTIVLPRVPVRRFTGASRR